MVKRHVAQVQVIVQVQLNVIANQIITLGFQPETATTSGLVKAKYHSLSLHKGCHNYNVSSRTDYSF